MPTKHKGPLSQPPAIPDPPPPPPKLEDMTLEHLKSLAYDQLVELQRIQTNINLIQAEISKRKSG